MDIVTGLMTPWRGDSPIQVDAHFQHDAVLHYIPYNWLIAKSLRQDGYIGWNDLTYGGNSLQANTMECPGSWVHQLYRFLPFWDGWNYGLVAQFFIAGLGVLVWARRRKYPVLLGLAGAVAFAFNAQFIVWIYHRWNLGALCWLPWILWAFERNRGESPGRRINRLLPGLFIGLAFRGGHLQSCLHVVIFVSILALTDWWGRETRWRGATLLKTSLPYLGQGLLGTLIAADVLVTNIPAWLYGCGARGALPWWQYPCYLAYFPFMLLNPFLLSTQQGLDFMPRSQQFGFFGIQYFGTTLALLGYAALCTRKVDFRFKLGAVGILLVMISPMTIYTYTRIGPAFVLFALCMAMQYVNLLVRREAAFPVRRVLQVTAVLLMCWLAGSIVLDIGDERISALFRGKLLAILPQAYTARRDWMLQRIDVFLSQAKVWHPKNLVWLASLFTSLFAIRLLGKVSSGENRWNRVPNAALLLLLVATLAEISLFFVPNVTFSKRVPEQADGTLYPPHDSITKLRQVVGTGRIARFQAPTDKDFFMLNIPNMYGIRTMSGYDSVLPHPMVRAPKDLSDLQGCAAAGLSHLVFQTGADRAGKTNGWVEVLALPEFSVYENPLFKGFYKARTETGDVWIDPIGKTSNSRTFALPSGTLEFSICEGYASGWQWRMDGGKWHRCAATDLGTMSIVFDTPLSKTTPITLRFRPLHAWWGILIASLTCLWIASFSVRSFLHPNPMG